MTIMTQPQGAEDKELEVRAKETGIMDMRQRLFLNKD
jgi:hypothetical protein